MSRFLGITLSLAGLLAGSGARAQVRCPAGFSPVPRSGAKCVQDDCYQAGGTYDPEMRCACGEAKACTEEVPYKGRARRRCKDHCPERRIVACVPEGQPCPGEPKKPCKQDSDCPDCTYCSDGKCAQATALIATAAPPRRGRRAASGWSRSRVVFWPEKAWIARFLSSRGCRLRFGDPEDIEALVEQVSAGEVKALAYFDHCAGGKLKKTTRVKNAVDIFGKKQASTETHYSPALGGMTAEVFQKAVREVMEERLLEALRRQGVRRAVARQRAAEAAQQATRAGWLHFLLVSTCHSLDDTSMPDALVRPGGVYFGRKGTTPAGIPLGRHQRADAAPQPGDGPDR
jgi:hypothetical protein